MNILSTLWENVSDIVPAIGGFLAIIYGVILAWPKICESVGWISKRQKKKEEKEEQKLKIIFDKFFDESQERLAQMHDELTDKYMDKYVPPITERFDKVNEDNAKILKEFKAQNKNKKLRALLNK